MSSWRTHVILSEAKDLSLQTYYQIYCNRSATVMILLFNIVGMVIMLYFLLGI